jgi:hypothetical protein
LSRTHRQGAPTAKAGRLSPLQAFALPTLDHLHGYSSHRASCQPEFPENDQTPAATAKQSRDSRLSDPAEEDTIPWLNSVSAYDYIQALYRLCLVQSGSATLAEQAVRDIASSAFKKANRELEKVDFDALFRNAFERRQSYQKSSSTELTGWPQRLHLLPEPQRSTLTLFYLEILPPALIADIANLSLEQLAEAVRDGRSAIEAAGK